MLTDIACKSTTCPADKPRARFADTGGLYLEVTPNGAKRWFWKYRFDGKEKRIAFGSYPAVKLKEARVARDDARKLQQQGIDPAQKRQLDRLENKRLADVTFEAVARECHATKAGGWSKQYGERWIERMEKDLFPWIGALPLASITAPMLLQTLKRIEARGAKETAHTLRQTAGQVFRYGIATGRCERNPAPDLHGALMPINVKHMAAVLDAESAGKLMRSIFDYEGQPTTRAAMELSALLFQRPGCWRRLNLDSVCRSNFDRGRVASIC